MAKKKTTNSVEKAEPKIVTTRVIKPPFFEHKGIQIPKKMRLTKDKFFSIFQGKIRCDINEAWEAYQEYLK